MASIIGKGLGQAQKTVAKVQQAEVFTSPLNKVWRLVILTNRALSTKPKDTTRLTHKLDDIKNRHLARETSHSLAQAADPWHQNKIMAQEFKMDPKELLEMFATDSTMGKIATKRKYPNDIIILNTATSPATSITIQNRPNEVAIEPGTTWTSVKAFGRNNSHQIYTGSEDTLSFEVSWYATEESREDVIIKCRLLESWSKADGYLSSPPILNLLWGNSGLFDNHNFILTNAAYKLSNFQESTKTPESVGKAMPTIKDLKLFPNCATQTLVFKRVSMENLTHSDIVKKGSLKGINGIKVE